VNSDEVRQILLIYRPDTTDADDPDVAQALALVKNDPELARWFEEHCARQNALRDKFRQIPVLSGLKEQIISEEAAKMKSASHRQKIVGVAAVAAILVAFLTVGVHFLPHKAVVLPPDNTLASYENNMLVYASAGYKMDLLTNDADQVRAYIAKNQAPADYILPAGLQNTAISGCAVENWDSAKVSMICFLTGKPLAQNRQSDLWLFVVNSSAMLNPPINTTPQLAAINGLMTATWSRNGKVYLLGVAGNESTIQKYL
jgi:hypothetical protein